MQPREVEKYYSSEDIASQIAAAAKGREAVGAYSDGKYDKRPNVIQYPKDVPALAEKGITSFHISVERWRFPMQLNTADPTTYERLRTGWDLLLDIDSNLGWEDAASAARLVCDLLEKYGVKSYGMKFSGRRGFHIVVPAEAFPMEVDYEKVGKVYPRIPRIIAGFIREKIKDKLMMELTSKHTFKELLSTLSNPPSELIPYLFVEIEKDWGARHLFRAPYSLNEKTWLASLPLKKSDLKKFDIQNARPEKVLSKTNRESFVKSAKAGEATGLLQDALDWHALQNEAESPKKVATRKSKFEIKEKVPEKYFPPCVKLILNGLKDGRKRSTFTLINFLRNVGWSWEDTEERLMEWNAKNQPALPRSFVLGQLRWHIGQKRKISAAKCAHDQFYRSISLCQPDELCKRGGIGDKITLKNPAGYPFRAMPGLKFSGSGKKPAVRGLSCASCSKEFETWKGLNLHTRRAH